MQYSEASFRNILTRREAINFGLAVLLAQRVRAQGVIGDCSPELIQHIPPRPLASLTGSQFIESISGMDRHTREQAILQQLLNGNLPEFLRKLVPIKLHCFTPDHKTLSATVFVMPDYLTIGSDSDFLRIPMNLHTAIAIADRFNFLLPTRKIVDAIYEQSNHRFSPQPMQAGPQMSSTAYYRDHNEMIEGQCRARDFSHGALVAGHKKDVVVSNRLASRPSQIAIYGWHRAVGEPIQPLSTVHGAGYADYSHGIRLVSKTILIESAPHPIHEVLRDPWLSKTISDEGPITSAAALGHA